MTALGFWSFEMSNVNAKFVHGAKKTSGLCSRDHCCLFSKGAVPLLDLPGQGPPLCLQPVSLVKKQLGCDPELALELPQQLGTSWM